MNLDKVQEIIREASNAEQDSMTNAETRSIVIKDGWQAKKVQNYEFNNIQILDSHAASGDWERADYAIISFDKGLALVMHHESWDYTFNHMAYEVEIVESHSWDDFRTVCLTNELRDKFRDLVAEMEILR